MYTAYHFVTKSTAAFLVVPNTVPLTQKEEENQAIFLHPPLRTYASFVPC